MEHMKQKWKATRTQDGVLIHSESGHSIAYMIMYLPGDAYGEKTARAIVDAHNAAIEKEQT